MVIRSLKGALNKLEKTKEKQRKEQLKAMTGFDWLKFMQEEYIKQTNQPDNFTIEETNVSITPDVLDFIIISQSNNTRLMNPVARNNLKSWIKDWQKNLESRQD